MGFFPSSSSSSPYKKKADFGSVVNVTETYSITRTGETHTKVIDVPSPMNGKFRIDNQLEPSRYLLMEFKGIHNSHYIGINAIKFYGKDGNLLPFQNIAVDGDYDAKPAIPPRGWWAVLGGDHSLLFDFGDVTLVKEVYIYCANSASTPKFIFISDSTEHVPDPGIMHEFSLERNFQLAGKPGADPTKIMFVKTSTSKETVAVSCEDIITSLNENPPSDGFEGFLSDCGKYQFVFYEKGFKTHTFNYYFGRDPKDALDTLFQASESKNNNPVVIEDVAHRAMSLEELRAIRALIVSDCVSNKWKSSWDGRRLRPEDVNLYDLNAIVIKPMTKKRKCAFKELFQSGPTMPTYYVSHWWGENVLNFIQCCETHAFLYGLDASEANYWVCAYANRQHDLGADMGTDPAESSFNRAMKLSRGVYLVVDPNVVATSRIWVDYELYKTIHSHANIDIGIYMDGKVHLITAKGLPDESPYQTNRRERKTPFEQIASSFLNVELYKGEASQIIDKVRILNTMCGRRDDLDNASVLERIESADVADEQYVSDMKILAKSDRSLRAEMAVKWFSVALSDDRLSPSNFYGLDLIDIVKKDTDRSVLAFDDIVSLPNVTDRDFLNIVDLVGPQVERFELNVQGCVKLTNDCLYQMSLPHTLKHVNLNVSFSPTITNDAIVNLAESIPPNLETLCLEVTGFKDPSGTYLPQRYNTYLLALASTIPTTLEEFSLVSNLDGEEDGSGLVSLASALCEKVSSLKKCTMFFRWQGFNGQDLNEMVDKLPSSLEELSLKFHGGSHVTQEEIEALAEKCKKFDNMKTFNLSSRDDGRMGFYNIRGISSLGNLNALASRPY